MLSCVLCAGAFLFSQVACAQAELRPVPMPDTSKLAPDKAKQVADARANFDKVKPNLIGPPLAQAYADLGAFYARAGLNEAAAAAFYDASMVNPNDGRWFYLRGVIARQLKQNTQARGDFETALALDKVYLPIRYRLADTLVDLGDVDGARKVLEQTAAEHKDQAIPLVMLGQLALKQQRYGEAIDNLNHALKIEPQANALYGYLAEAYKAQGNTQAAQDARAKAGNAAPGLADPIVAGMYRDSGPQVSGTPLQQAQQYAAQGQVDEARKKLGEIFKTTPNDADALMLSARLEAAMGNSAVAQTFADQALKLKPGSGTANLARGMVYEFAGDDANAYDFYQRAVRADAKLGDARLLLGNAEMRRGHYAQAAEQYLQMSVLQPQDASAYAHLVAAESMANQCATALAWVKSALAKQPQNGDLMQVFVRAASSCSAATPEVSATALNDAQMLYKQHPTIEDTTALAMVMASQGKFKEAQEYQAEAIFDAVRVADKEAAAMFKATMKEYVAKQKPERPWPPQHPYFKASMLTPATMPVAAKKS